ncbi:MAG TPA: hypothetical protein ENH25_09920 [candidate division Zixibacteria bacterium]|nr:hypothetical protein [candidate division Zixibacteria bacterium]
MQMLKSILFASLIIILAVAAVSGSGLDKLMSAYAEARMINFDVRISVVSEIFGSTDTTFGDITIADDGRYAAHIGNDSYIFDGKCIWEYSADNNQATKSCLKEGELFENELFFIKNLRKYYKVALEKEDTLFLLVKTNPESNQLPDSLNMILREGRISDMDYFDLNRDLNRVHIIHESLFDKVDPTVFKAEFPDSTEVISLP